MDQKSNTYKFKVPPEYKKALATFGPQQSKIVLVDNEGNTREIMATVVKTTTSRTAIFQNPEQFKEGTTVTIQYHPWP